MSILQCCRSTNDYKFIFMPMTTTTETGLHLFIYNNLCDLDDIIVKSILNSHPFYLKLCGK